MIQQVRYGGALIPESRVPGEGKRAGMTPNYAQGIRLSPDRWLVLYDTVDVRGWDVWRGVFCQVRADSPTGPVVRETMLTPPQPVGPPLDDGQLWRHCGQPCVFGMPADSAGPNANVFAITWMNILVLESRGALKRATPELQRAMSWPAGVELDAAGYREITQVRFNADRDDLEVLAPRQRLTQTDAPGNSFFGWSQPVADNASGTTWIEAVCLLSRIGVVRYDFNPVTGLYEWTRSSTLEPVGEGYEVGEPALVKLGDGEYVLSVRGFNQGGSTYWYRTRDPLSGLGKPTPAPDTYGQRYAFLCADGRLRIFLNNRNLSPYGDRRNPLYVIDVDPDSFAYAYPRVLLDTRQVGLRLRVPFVDHVHLFAPQGNRQILSHRTITARQVARSDQFPDVSPEEWQDGGIHWSEIVYG